MSFGGGSFGGSNSTGNSTGGGSSFGGGSSGGPPSSSCNNPRGQILEAFFLIINPLNCWLILSRFYVGRGIYFGREKKWSTILQLFMLSLYVLRIKGVFLKLLLDRDPSTPTTQFLFSFFSGYAQYLMIIYKSTQIILTYFRNKMRTERVLVIVDGIFAFVTVAFVVTYAIPAELWFKQAGFSYSRKGLDFFNWEQLALALVAFVSSSVLVYLILRAEQGNPFKNIILNRNMFLVFIALQLAAMLFMNGLNIATVLGSNLLGQPTTMRTAGFLMIDICILFFEWNHGKLFVSGEKKTTTSANSKKPLRSGTTTQNQRTTVATTSIMGDDTASKV